MTNATGRNSDGGLLRFPGSNELHSARFPDGMRETLKQAAAANRRSMNAEIMARLEASFGDNPVLPGPTPSAVASSLDAQVAAAIERHVQAEVAARLQRIAGALNAGGE